jgi:hypothetical protein
LAELIGGIVPLAMIDRLFRVVSWLMNRVRVNQVEQRMQDGVCLFIKRRRTGAGVVIWCANWFLWLTRSGCQMFVQTREWIDWEVYCTGLLYPQRIPVRTGPGPAIAVPAVPGTSLRELLGRNEADISAFIAAAHELRRVHQISCSRYQDAWSHGDLHLDNILYDRLSNQVAFIDFDTRHEPGLNRVQRQADDLKTMILELIGLPEEPWRQFVTVLIKEYGDREVLSELARQLVIPHGVARVLWHARTYGCDPRQVERHLTIILNLLKQDTTH